MHNLAVRDGAPVVELDPAFPKALDEYATAYGNTAALSSLASLLTSGEPGVEWNPVRAKALYEDAIERGDLHGKTSLAVLLSIGAGTDIDRDAERSKLLYEQVIEKGDRELKGFAIPYYSHFLMFGYGEGRELSCALALFQKCVDDDGVHGMLGLGLLLWKGGDGIKADCSRSKQLFRDVLHHRGNSVYLDYDLGSCFQFLFQSSDTDIPPIPSELYIGTRRPAKHFAQLFLGIILLQDLTSDDDDISFKSFLKEEEDDDIIQFVKALQTNFQEHRLSSGCALQIAYTEVVHHPNNLNREMNISKLTTENVSSMNEVLAGLNILLLARNQGVLTDKDIHGTTDLGWHVHRKFYLPASQLRDADPGLLELIFHDPQLKGIIQNGIQFVIANKLTSDMEVASRQINDAFETISKRFLKIEENISTTFDLVSTLSKDLNKLHDLFKLKNKADKHAALV